MEGGLASQKARKARANNCCPLALPTCIDWGQATIEGALRAACKRDSLDGNHTGNEAEGARLADITNHVNWLTFNNSHVDITKPAGLFLEGRGYVPSYV
ncbi:hypothetical protein IP69_14620 [Bosea sp. AAP35]|nr:hypothetical protein IP69_14620 [Bosea sp. AAP35]